MPRITTVLVDWGSTNARAFGLDRDGQLVSGSEQPLGVRSVAAGGFPEALERLVEPFTRDLATTPTYVMSGMVGSRQGWLETDYVPCPARRSDLASALRAVPGRDNAWIVPGVCRGAATGHPNVMRGEEVQVFGAVGIDQLDDALICVPGTHSKWISFRHGRIQDFATAATGETFEVLRGHSLLGALMPDRGAQVDLNSDQQLSAFRRGLDRTGDAGGLLHQIFGARTMGLFSRIPANALAAYLSGIMIGHEIGGMIELFPGRDQLRLVASGSLAALYSTAFEHIGMAHQAIDAGKATLRGLGSILEAAPISA